MIKTCTRCNKEKPTTKFHKAKDGIGGVRGECKACSRIQKAKAWNTKYYGLRTEALTILGNKCQHCNENDPIVLAIDHINNNGAQDRQSFTQSWDIFKAVKKDAEPYQLLCHNCNWRKRMISE